LEDTSDIPFDNNECTEDICIGSTPSNPALLGQPCSSNGGIVCNSTGSCAECLIGTDCPGTDTECQTRTCTFGECAFLYTLRGVPLANQTVGDCQVLQCDGNGLANQNNQKKKQKRFLILLIFYCFFFFCYFANLGMEESVADDADIPIDGNECTGDVCTSGNP
jgi:hypothetical protein